mgnify:CR=1 FL=1
MRVSQTDKLYDLLSDGNAHRTDEIVSKVYSGGSLARVGARIFDVKKKYGVEIIGWHDEKNPSLYWYQIKAPAFEDMPEYEMFFKRQHQLM